MEGVDLVGFRHDGDCGLGRAFRHFCVWRVLEGQLVVWFLREAGGVRELSTWRARPQSAAAAKNIYRFPGKG